MRVSPHTAFRHLQIVILISNRFIITGHLAVASVRQYNADMMFFSCSGISAEKGLSSIEAEWWRSAGQ